MVFDRGYDDNKVIDLVDKNGDYFVVRMDDKRIKVKRKIVMKWQLEEKEKLK